MSDRYQYQSSSTYVLQFCIRTTSIYASVLYLRVTKIPLQLCKDKSGGNLRATGRTGWPDGQDQNILCDGEGNEMAPGAAISNVAFREQVS